MKEKFLKILGFFLAIFYLTFPSQENDEIQQDDFYSDQLPPSDSWDNLYLCKYCDTEIIYDVTEVSEEEEEDVGSF